MIISDTSVITNLISIEHIFLLQALYENVIIPQAVYEELSRCHPLFLSEIQAEKSPFLEVKTVKDKNKVSRLALKIVVMTREQGTGNREQEESFGRFYFSSHTFKFLCSPTYMN